MINKKFNEIYTQILSSEYKGEPIWKLIQNETLTAVTHFVGHHYESSETKFMIIGRAVNGWEVAFPNCSNLENTLHSIMNQPQRLDDVVDSNGIKYTDANGTPKTYYYSRSPFWRLIKKVLETYGESENWNQKILWSNLYKIAPRKTGNPSWSLIKQDLQLYIDCIVEEINTYKPDKVLFVTDSNFFRPYTQYPSFADALNVTMQASGKYIVGTGKYNDSSIVVCKRPEFRSTDEMVIEIKEQFDLLDRQ